MGKEQLIFSLDLYFCLVSIMQVQKDLQSSVEYLSLYVGVQAKFYTLGRT